MKIGILETGLVPDDLRDTFKSYPSMFETMLGAIDPTLTFQTWTVVLGDFPESMDAADAWIITGSKHGVYENEPWMIRLQDLLRDMVTAKTPVFGVCFGHQILAAALGGKVVKSDKGWGIGVHEYVTSNQAPAWLGDAPQSFKLNAFHQDQVVELPEGAVVWASSEFCPYAALQYGETAASIQPHPEFQRPYEEALLKARYTLLPEDVHSKASSSLEGKIDSDLFAKWILNFLQRNQAIKAA
ncbi:glutamine amidotransferase-related protein [Thalassospira alkalitolerans]|uniref:Glutamine amidotransferase n=1 Tax=Thalassospira alkalitolerans TaxID=1293890 RepID=A0A1Y2LGT5_9PROT|nr:gamma-glutamyl-gamma-aminobutyrate hydrolase family protein [Thalassospira alkalitolerans]OSQ50296.1 glutamine amidotransferase [Thalassospira alkalitolerans]